MKMWICRDEDKELWVYKQKPYLKKGNYWYARGGIMPLEIEDFPEVTFENSPMEVELKLIGK